MEQSLNTGGMYTSLTASTRLLNQRLGTSPEPRRLTPSEIALLRQSKQEIAQCFDDSYARRMRDRACAHKQVPVRGQATKQTGTP